MSQLIKNPQAETELETVISTLTNINSNLASIVTDVYQSVGKISYFKNGSNVGPSEPTPTPSDVVSRLRTQLNNLSNIKDQLAEVSEHLNRVV